MKSLDFEENIGIETFFTKELGIGGKLRSLPEDFIVKEIFLYPNRKENGLFTIAEISSRNWETNNLVREMSKRLHISRRRISFAGTKDKRACSTQLMSFYNIPEEKLSHIKIKDMTMENIYSSDRPIKIGDLYGNKFEITVRSINRNIKPKKVKGINKILYRN